MPRPTKRPNSRAMTAWYAGAIVRYGCCQSPNTPRRRNSLRWISMNRAAYSRHFCRLSTGSIALRTSIEAVSRPSSLST